MSRDTCLSVCEFTISVCSILLQQLQSTLQLLIFFYLSIIFCPVYLYAILPVDMQTGNAGAEREEYDMRQRPGPELTAGR